MEEPTKDQAAKGENIPNKECPLCRSEHPILHAGICGSCSERLMRELLETNEWKWTVDRMVREIRKGIDGGIQDHERREHR